MIDAKPTTSRTPASTRMRAVVQDRYGEPEAVLSLQEIAKPVVKDGEVLVRVHAASVHVGDVVLARGLPYLLRLATGPRKPRHRVPGTDIAGTVEAVGKDVTQLRPGDEVFGWCAGAFAEYACAGADHFVPKPATLTFEQAAAMGCPHPPPFSCCAIKGRSSQAGTS
jgi:NADPH:quinone reductase-like Zn-dependent oxidoreductase